MRINSILIFIKKLICHHFREMINCRNAMAEKNKKAAQVNP
jgi:hypothetical protein